MLLVYIATLPMMSFFSLRSGGVIPSDLVFLAVLLFWIPAELRSRTPLSTFEILLALYLGATLLSTLVASAGPGGLVKTSYLVAVAAVTGRTLSRDPVAATSAWLVGNWLAVIGSLLGVASFYLGWTDALNNPFLGHYGTLPSGPYPRVTSFFFSPNMLCNYFIVGAVLSWYRSRRILLAGTLGSALFTFSSGLGGLAVALGLLGRRAPGVAVGLLVGGLSLLAVLVDPAALLQGQVEWSGRVLTWQGALSDWLAHPLTGSGPGGTSIKVVYPAPWGVTLTWTNAHNIWLSVASQTGVLGLAALIAVVLFCLRRSPSRWPELQSCLRIALVGAVLVHGLSGSFEDSRHLWVLMGMLAATRTPARFPDHPSRVEMERVSPSERMS